MRKTIVTLVALCAAMTANATILRVSNVNGSTAPYSTIQAAHDAASAGDTIMVDGSNTVYEQTEISKKLVFVGPGFWINENGMVQESVPSATVSFVVHKEAAGTVIEGFRLYYYINYAISIRADNCVVRRCYLKNGSGVGIQFSRDDDKDPNPTGAVIHQNFFDDCGIGIYRLEYETSMTNLQITNNIFVHNDGSHNDISSISNSYIAYNTMVGGANYYQGFAFVNASTIEHNIIRLIKTEEHYKNFRNEIIRYGNMYDVDDNEWSDNVEKLSAKVEYNTDKDIPNIEWIKEYSSNYGAFAGDSPYILSGIPAAPMIEDLVVPTSVEAGSKLNVTIKLGIQR